MDEEKKQQLEEERTKSNIDRDNKNKSKTDIKTIAKRLSTVIAVILPLLKFIAIVAVIAIVISCVTYLFNLKGHNNMAAVSASEVMKEHVTIDKTEDNEYYFKIDKQVIDDYLKMLNEAYYNGYYFSNDPENDENMPEHVYDKDDPRIKKEDIEQWFKTEKYEPYLIKMIRAEIASSYPKLGDYLGEEGTEDKQGNKTNKDGDYVAQGVVEIKRTTINRDGTQGEVIPLQYLPYETEEDMTNQPNEGDQNNQGGENQDNQGDQDDPNNNDNQDNQDNQDENNNDENNQDNANNTNTQTTPTISDDEEPRSFKQLINANSPRALNYFSFDEGTGIIYYATYVESTTTLDGEETEHTYTIQENTMSYQAVTSMCSMPYNFLFALLQKSENPEYVMKVIDLLLQDTELVLMIQDQLSESIYDEEKDQVEKTTVTTYRKQIRVVGTLNRKTYNSRELETSI